jgi:hypothetical protein
MSFCQTCGAALLMYSAYRTILQDCPWLEH